MACGVAPMALVSRENFLMRHCEGCIFGILRLAFRRYAPSGGAQDDKGCAASFPKNIFKDMNECVAD